MTLRQVQRLLEENHELGVSYRSVHRYVRSPIRPLERPVTVRLHPPAGEQAQVDFGYAGRMRDPESGKWRRAWAFILILSHSRHRFVRFVFSAGQPHLAGLSYPRPEVLWGLSHPDRARQSEKRSPAAGSVRSHPQPSLRRTRETLWFRGRPSQGGQGSSQGRGRTMCARRPSAAARGTRVSGHRRGQPESAPVGPPRGGPARAWKPPIANPMRSS